MKPGLWIILILGALTLMSILVGVAPLADDGLWLVWVSRLPRSLAALLTGASLAVAGTVMQVLTRNRFVEPSTAGTAQAAGVGLIAITLLAPGVSIMGKILAALLASLVGTFGFVAILRRLPQHDPLLVPLVGIVYGGIIGAVGAFIAYEQDLIQYLDVWTGGELSGVVVGRYETLYLSAALLALVYVFANRFTIVGLGEDMSRNLGLSYQQVLALGLAIVATITAVTVVTVGMMPFVGLVVPNIAARLWGDNLRRTLPFVGLCGAGLVLACDIVGRLIRFPYEIPAGTILGVLGSAVFLWLLYGRAKHA